MDLLLALTFGLVVVSFVRGDGSRGLSIEQTSTVNGLFVVLVFLSHFYTYWGDANTGLFYPLFQKAMGQLVVVPFFLFSGYGIMASIQKKGETYAHRLATRRAPRLLLRFDVCVLLFLILNIVLNIEYPPVQIVFAFLTVTSIGNSNWFIMTTLVCYLFVALANLLRPKKAFQAIAVTTLLLAIYAVACSFGGFPARYYNTVIAFPLGMLLREIEPLTDSFVKRLNNARYWLLLGLGLVLSFLPALIPDGIQVVKLLIWTIRVISFCVVLYLVLCRFEFRSKVFRFFGKHVFTVYMLQRLPMILLFNLGLLEPFTILRACIAMLVTLGLAFLIERLFVPIDRLFERS